MNFLQGSGDSLFNPEATLLALFVVIILVRLTAWYSRLPYTTILIGTGSGIPLRSLLAMAIHAGVTPVVYSVCIVGPLCALGLGKESE